MIHPADSSRGVAALVAGAVCIGFAPIWVRWSEAGPVATAALRLTLALPFLGVWVARERLPRATGRSVAANAHATVAWVIASGTLFALDLGVWHLSIRFTTVANATLLGNLAPIFVAIGAWIFFRERVGATFLAGLVLALLGAWALTRASLGVDPSRLRGDLLGATTALFYGGYQLCVARLRRDWRAGRVLTWSSIAALPLLWLGAATLGERLLPVSAAGWGVILGLAITAQVLGQGLITYGFAHLPARHSSIILLIQPLVAGIAGWILLGEALRGIQCLGGVVLLLGIMLARRAPVSPGARSARD